MNKVSLVVGFKKWFGSKFSLLQFLLGGAVATGGKVAVVCGVDVSFAKKACVLYVNNFYSYCL